MIYTGSSCRSWMCLGICVFVLIGGASAHAGEGDSSARADNGRRRLAGQHAAGKTRGNHSSNGLGDIPWCGTKRLGEAQLVGSVSAGSGAGDCSFFNTNPLPIYDPSVAKYRFPVVIHVIQTRAGVGYLNKALVQTQVDVLNEAFLALPGTPGAPGTDIQIEFYLATQDPYGNPTNGITYSTNDAWFQGGDHYWEHLAWNPRQYINIYSFNTDAAGSIAGTPGDIDDVVGVTWMFIGRDDWSGKWNSMGHVATHEVGHYFGLNHTFGGGCDIPGECYTSGDLICDTNPHANSADCDIEFTSTCGAFPTPNHNYMNYIADVCMTEFTPEQARRMRCWLESNRSSLMAGGGVCGNGTVEAAVEDCEPPNTTTCDARCQRIPTCGDGIVDWVPPVELCDDGNTVAGDGCSPTCQFETIGNCCTAHAGPGCGNPQIEACVCVDFPSCCTTAWEPICAIVAGQSNSVGTVCGNCSECGDGILGNYEECEPPGTATCDVNCKVIPICGDSIRQAAEECEDGNTVAGDGCDANCVLEGLGDCCTASTDRIGCSNAYAEACVCAAMPWCCTLNWDYSCIDAVDGADCGTCRNGVCGNGVVEAGEYCEPPGTATCDVSCQWIPTCGNGFLEAIVGEECDDGNTVSGDGCDATCKLESMGNCCGDAGGPGCSNAAVEACVCASAPDCCGTNGWWGLWCADWVNVFHCGYCSAGPGTCGNGVFDSGEDCEPPNTAICDANCQRIPACGDGAIDFGEQCDDGNARSGDGCAQNCTMEGTVTGNCGNGTVDPGEQCEPPNTATCDATCQSISTGTGIPTVSTWGFLVLTLLLFGVGSLILRQRGGVAS